MSLFLYVALFVATDFLFPKVGVGLGHFEALAVVVSVPETSVDKNNGTVFSEYYVGMAWESGMVETIAESAGKEKLSHHNFGACSLAFYCCHAAVALLLCHLVHLAAKIRINSDIAKEIRGFFIGYRCKGD